MLVLFAVAITQVSHTHSFGLAVALKNKADKKTKHLSADVTNVSASNCFICDYQLTKDADASYFLPQVISSTEFYSCSFFSYPFTSTGIPSFFETRGPPYFI